MTDGANAPAYETERSPQPNHACDPWSAAATARRSKVVEGVPVLRDGFLDRFEQAVRDRCTCPEWRGTNITDHEPDCSLWNTGMDR